MAYLTQDEWKFLTNGAPAQDNENYLCTITCTDQNILVVANLPETFSTDIGAQYEEAFAQAVNNSGIVSSVGPKLRALGIQMTTQALTAQIWQGSTEMSFSLPLVLQARTDEIHDVLEKLEALYSLTLPGESFSNGFLTAPGPVLDAEILLQNVGSATSAAMNAAGSIAKDAVTNSIGSTLSSAFSKLRSLSPSTAATAEASPSKKPDTANKGVDRPLVSAIKNNISLQIGRYMYFESVVITNVGQTHHVQPLESGIMSRVEVTVQFKTFYVPTKKDIPNIFRNAKFNPAGRKPSNGV